MNKNKLLLILLLPIYFTGSAQDVKQVEFKDSAKYEIVSGDYSKEDAVLILEDRTLTLYFEGYTPMNTIKTHSKLKILTKKGITDYSRIIIPKMMDNKITQLAVRTIKKNGQVIKLNINDIKQLDVSNNDDIYTKDKFILFSIPGVEIEDEIEIYTLYEGYAQYSDDIYLNSYLPCIHSKFTLLTVSEMDIELKMFNGMPKPKVTDMKYMKSEWEKDTVPSFSDQNFSIPSKDQPYFRYVIRNVIFGKSEEIPIVKSSWTSYIDEIFSSTETTKRKVKSFSSFLDKKFGVIATEASADEKLKYLVKVHHYITDSISVEWLTYAENGRTLVSLMNDKRIDSDNLLLVYDNLFEHLNINYFIGYGRSKYAGEFDVTSVAPHMITNSFISFELDGFYYFLFLKDYYNSYELGEIPIELQGTNTILISKQQIPDRIKQAKLITTDKQNNYRRVKTTVNINLNELTVSGNTKRQYAGAVATDRKPIFKGLSPKEMKEDYEMFNKADNPNFVVDSITSDFSNAYKFPYSFNVNYSYHLKQSDITKLDEKLYSIPLNKWFQNSIIKSTTHKRISDLYCYFQYTDNIKLYLIFDKKIELNNKQDIESKTTNEFGSYFISIKQLNETTLLLESNYEINTPVLLKENYEMVKDLEKSFEKANTNQLVIKVIE